MKQIDYTNDKPFFTNGTTKWYSHKEFNSYLIKEQVNNLPSLDNLSCFVVIGKDINDLVLINNKQNILGSYSNNREGADQMTCKINIIKIAKHYDEHEKSNI